MQNQIPKNWQKVKLGDVCFPVSDTFDFSKNSKFVFINTGDIENGKFLHKNYFNESYLPGQAKKTIRNGDILYSEIRPKNRHFAFVDFNSHDFVVSTKLMVIRNNEKIDPNFLYIFLTNKRTVDSFQTIAESRSGTFPQLTFDSIADYQITLPSLEEQRSIYKAISAFDDNIEVNNKIAKTLEEMAQAIFKEWFVKFKFPGHEKAEFINSELGRTPKGWEVKKIKDVAKINKGISYSSEEIKDNSVGLPMINLANFQRGGGFNPDGIKFYTGRYKITDLVKPGDIVIAMTDLTSNREVIGHPARVPYYAHWNKILISLDVCSIETEDSLVEFLYYLMFRKDFAYQMASSAGGTNVAHLSKSMIENYSFILPEKRLMEKFQSFVKPVFHQINTIELENQKLAALRDLLLAKLMRGEIRI